MSISWIIRGFHSMASHERCSSSDLHFVIQNNQAKLFRAYMPLQALRSPEASQG